VIADLQPPPPRPGKSRPAERRFDRLVRLVSVAGFRRLQDAHVMVFGLGGVGGFAAEGLARSGVGRLTLVDFDVVCATNLNRQIQALAGNVGQAKAIALADRIRAIHPACAVLPKVAYYTPARAAELLDPADPPTWVVDAIDNVAAKLHLLDRCRAHGIPVVSSMGAAGRLDPTQVRVSDLYQTSADPLARAVRKQLRQRYGWPRPGRGEGDRSGVTVVHSIESRRLPLPPEWDRDTGFQCVCPPNPAEIHPCSHRHLIEGSAVFVTSVFGMTAAAVVVRAIVGDLAAPTAIERGRRGADGAQDGEDGEQGADPQ